MQLKRLELARVRVFEQAEFDFQPGMNLLVGINGAGKSTVLDVLRIMLSQSLPKFTVSKSQPIPFEESDISVGHEALTTELSFETGGVSFEHLMHVPREKYGDDDIEKDREYTTAHHVDRRARIRLRREQQEAYKLERRNDLKPDDKAIPRNLKNSIEQPLAVYYSTRRSNPVERKPGKQSSTGGQSAAYADALAHRELNIREFAERWLVQDELSNELGDNAVRRLAALNDAIVSFLDDCTNLRAVREPTPTMLVDKGEAALNIRQLSDGERSMVALVFDLVQRLVQANPKLDNPLKDGQAVVLIDELDLHLHPRWQRTICEKLTNTFPNCQFIATTHSPQIIGEVQPDSLIFLIKESDRIQVRSGRQGFGLDTNWILEHLMDTPSRNIDTKQQIDRVEKGLEEGDLDTARLELERLRQILHGPDGEVIRLEASINTLEALADEVD